MSEKLPPEKNVDDSCPEYQRNKAPTKIPGTAVFRSPYSVSSKSAGCTPYYIMTSTGTGTGVPNASDEDKRRIMHNEVERKRKDKINKWIVRLCALVPDCNGKLSKNCILEKTVNFIQQLMQEQQLPDDVQALKVEVIKLTKNVESLSSENSHYLNLLKEAQNLSKGAWTLNMSIQRNSSTSQSSSSDGDDTTMTPTLDRVSVSNLTKVSSAPNLPAIVPAPPKLITLPTMGGTLGMPTLGGTLGVPIMSASGQPTMGLPIMSASGQPTMGLPIMSASGQPTMGLPIMSASGQPTMGLPIMSASGQPTLGVPIMSASGQPAITGHSIITGQSVINGQSVIAGQPIKVLQPQTGGTNIGSMVTALPANQLSTAQSTGPTLLASPIVANGHPVMANGHHVMANGHHVMANGHPVMANGHPVMANGHPIVASANGHPILANVQVKDGNVIKSTANGASHSIQALLGGDTSTNTTNTTNTLYSLPAYLQPLANNEGAAANAVYMATQNSPLVQHQTPVLVQGDNGPVIMMIPGSLPHFAVPLNTMSSHQFTCEPTSSFKSPIICNQFSSLLNYYDQPVQNTGLQFGSVIQGPQGQQSVVVGTQQQPTVMQPTGQTVLGMQPTGQTVLGMQPTGQTVIGMQPTGQTVLGMQPTGQTVLGMQLAGQTVLGMQPTGQTMLGMQPTGQTILGMQSAGQTMLGMQSAAQAVVAGAPLIKVVSGSGDHTLIQVPNSTEAVLIPQTTLTMSSQPTQCFIPLDQVLPTGAGHALVHQVSNTGAVTVTPVTMTPVTSVTPVTAVHPTSTPIHPNLRNTNVTDFSISQIHGLSAAAAAAAAAGEDTKEPMDASGDIYLTSMNSSDASFSSDCFTPPYTSSNMLISSATFRDSMSPDGEGESKPQIAHSIASLTGRNQMNNN